VDALSLQRCAKRAKQLGLRELESAALLCFARDALDYARTDECYEQEVLTRAYAPSKASRATLAAWKLAEDAAAFEAPGPRDGPDTSMLMQTPQQRLERERKERREGQQDPQGLPKDCEIKDRSTVATNPTEGSIFRARCRRFMVQAAINGHNQFKRAQALEGKALLQAEQRYLQRQRRRRGVDENDSSGDLPEDRAPCVPRELACVDIAFECLFGDFDAGDMTHELGEGLKPPTDVPPSEELPADPDGSLRAASEAATAKALGLDMEDIEVRTRRLVKPESAAEPSTPSPRRVRTTQVPKREEHENHIGPPGLNVAYDLALKRLEENRCPNKGASNIVERAQYLLRFEWAVHRHALRRAAALHEALLGVSPRQSDYDVECHVEALRCDLRLSVARDDYERAVKGAAKLERICGNRGLWALQAKLLCDRSKWLLDGCPQEPVPAMNPALRALALCEQWALDALHAEATLRLALVQLGLGNIPKARDAFQQCQLKILEQSHVDVQGDLWYALAQCELEEKAYALRHRQEGRTDVFENVDTTDFRKVIFFYKRALECYSYVQHRKRMQDCHYFLARTYHQLEEDPAMMRLRDHHAKRALELQADMNRAVADFEDLPCMWIIDE
jgi:tetratricopeptide (TPR) repeat protein